MKKKSVVTTGFEIAAAAILLATALAAFAQPAPPSDSLQAPLQLKFDIARYLVQGNTLLASEEIEVLVGRFAGKQRDFGDIQRALEALESAYRGHGYSAVQVFLPEQDVERGEVELRVVEARIRKLEIVGNKFFDAANVRASLPAVREGISPNATAIAKNLRIVNETPAKQTNLTLRAGENEGEVDAIADVSDEPPQKWFATLDNTGGSSTGYQRLGFGYQNSNLGNRDHAITLQFITSPDAVSRVGVYSIGYHLPLYERGASMDLVAGYSDVDAGTSLTPSGPLAFTGRGTVLGVRYNQHLDRIVGYDHKLVYAFDYRDYRNACSLGTFGAAGCGTAGASYTLTPVSVAYAGTWTLQSGVASINASANANLPVSSKGDNAAVGQARFGVRAAYRAYRFGANYLHAFADDWQVRARFDLQYAGEVLPPPEQFGIGGAFSVRGFLERERADDRGHSGSLELYGPDVAPRWQWANWNLRALGFFDLGRTQRVDPQPGEVPANGFSSAGLGLRLSHLKDFSLRLDVARIVNGGGTRQPGDLHGMFGAIWSF